MIYMRAVGRPPSAALKRKLNASNVGLHKIFSRQVPAKAMSNSIYNYYYLTYKNIFRQGDVEFHMKLLLFSNGS